MAAGPYVGLHTSQNLDDARVNEVTGQAELECQDQI